MGHVAILVAFSPTLIGYARNAAKHLWFHDDVRVLLWPFFRFAEPRAFEDDFLGDYALALVPTLYRAGMTVAGWLGAVEATSKVLPLLLLLVTAAGSAAAARRLGGPVAGLLAFAMALGTALFLHRMTGGIPRSFAYPLVAVALWLLARGSLRLLGLLVVVASGLYPTMGVIAGFALALAALGLVRDDRGDLRETPALRRVGFVGGVALGSAVMLAPLILSSSRYGDRISPSETDRFPEAGPGGIHGRADLPPFGSFADQASETLVTLWFERAAPLFPALRDALGPGWLFALLLIPVGIGWLVRAATDPASRRALTSLVGTYGAFQLAKFAFPYLYAPTRVTLYALPVLVIVGLAVTAADLGRLFRRVTIRRVPKQPSTGRAVSAQVAVAVGTFAVAGGVNDPAAGFVFRVPPDQARVYEVVGRLPPDTLVAGWPDDPMSNLPYLARRRAWVTGELAVGFHEGFVLAFRERLRVLFRAYLSADPEELANLRDRHGVTHLLVERRHLRRFPPGYRPPVGREIPGIVAKNGGRPPAIRTVADEAAIYRDSRYILLDLDRVGSTSTP